MLLGRLTTILQCSLRLMAPRTKPINSKPLRYVFSCAMRLSLRRGTNVIFVQVYPHSEIYFLEFRSPDSDQKYWTGRFLITATDGVSSPPTNSTTESNGEKILWGTGMLINATNPLPASSNTSSSLPVGSGTLSSTPASTQTGVNSGTSQDGSNGDMTVALSKVLVFAVGVVTVSTAFFL